MNDAADDKTTDTTGETRPLKGGEAPTTRFGMEDGDNTDVPATGLDPDQQGRPSDDSGSHQAEAEEEAAKLGDFA